MIQSHPGPQQGRIGQDWAGLEQAGAAGYIYYPLTHFSLLTALVVWVLGTGACISAYFVMLWAWVLAFSRQHLPPKVQNSCCPGDRRWRAQWPWKDFSQVEDRGPRGYGWCI